MKLTHFSAAVVTCFTVYSHLHGQQVEPRAITPKIIGRIERLHPELDQLVAPDAEIEAVADGFQWSEGPVWLPELNQLVFSDVPTNTAYSWSEKEGLAVYLRPSGYTAGGEGTGGGGSNGLALDGQKRLLLCQHGDRRLALMDAPLDEPQSDFVTLADKFRGKRFHSPNDLVVHSSGAIFFTDPPYGLAGGWDGPNRELSFQGVYRLDPNGNVALIADGLKRPNGIALSPDEKTLYVAQSDLSVGKYVAFDLNERLEAENRSVFFDAKLLAQERPGNPDGIKVDQHGNVFATGPGGVLVISPQGKHLGTIMTGTRIANLAFGNDGSTLYLTAQRYVCRVRLKTKGFGFNGQSIGAR